MNRKGNILFVLLTAILLICRIQIAVAENKECFTLSFTYQVKSAEPCLLLEIPGMLCVSIIDGKSLADDGGQNYAAFPMSDGSVPVLEARLKLRLPVGERELKDMPVGVPISLLRRPFGKHRVELVFSGARWSLYVDGMLADNDFPLGYPEHIPATTNYNKTGLAMLQLVIFRGDTISSTSSIVADIVQSSDEADIISNTSLLPISRPGQNILKPPRSKSNGKPSERVRLLSGTTHFS